MGEDESRLAADVVNLMSDNWIKIHLRFPVILEGGEGIFEERTREMAPIAAAEIEYGRSNRKSNFLDIFGRLWSIVRYFALHLLNTCFI